jgi:Nif-specific regulatory protein
MEWLHAEDTWHQRLLERHAQEFSTLHEISQALCATHDLESLLRLAIKRVVVLLAAEAATVLLFDEETDELYCQTTNDRQRGEEQCAAQGRFPVTQGIAGWVLRNATSVLVPDAPQDPRFHPHVDTRIGVLPRAYLCVPLKTGRRKIGVLTVASTSYDSFSLDDLSLVEAFAHQLTVAIENVHLRCELRQADTQVFATQRSCQANHTPVRRFATLVGESPSMQEVYRLVERVLETTTTVLITGESGTGKELIARGIHEHGLRAQGPFVAINCAAIPDTLLEAELFGYERGAFTDAVQRKIGRFELAAGGTLFLDEVSEMSTALQAKLLRVLQEKQFDRLGGTTSLSADVRIIAATNRALPRLIAEGKFREDLFYRLNVYPIPLPPLRERQGDILLLAQHLLQRSSQALNKPIVGFSREASTLLCRYQWPGNIRELENTVERAALLCQRSLITVDDLPPLRQNQSCSPLQSLAPQLPQGKMTFAELEKRCVEQALEQANYNCVQASRLLGLSRTQLRTRMKNYGLERQKAAWRYNEVLLKPSFGTEERQTGVVQ